MNRIVYLALASAVMLTSLSAQRRTWIVDSRGGVGVDFKDLRKAIAAAKTHDRIVVRGSADYGAFTVTKGIDIEASDGATAGPVIVRAIPKGNWLRLTGFSLLGRHTFSFGQHVPALHVEKSPGEVLVASSRLKGGTSGSHRQGVAAGCTLVDAGTVFFIDSDLRPGQGCVFGGDACVASGKTTLIVQRCIMTGGHAIFVGDPCGGSVAGSAITSIGARVLVAASTLQAGNGYFERYYAGRCIAATAGGTAVRGSGELLVMAVSTLAEGRGGAACTSACRTCPGKRGVDGLAVRWTGGKARVTDDTRRRAALIGATRSPALTWIAAPREARRGRPATWTIFGAPGTFALLYWDVHFGGVAPFPVPEGRYLLTVGAQPLLLERLGATGIARSTLVLPNDPALRNIFIFMQALSVEGTRASWTNLADLRIR